MEKRLSVSTHGECTRNYNNCKCKVMITERQITDLNQNNILMRANTRIRDQNKANSKYYTLFLYFLCFMTKAPYLKKQGQRSGKECHENDVMGKKGQATKLTDDFQVLNS